MSTLTLQPTIISVWALRVIERLEDGGCVCGPVLQAIGIDRHGLARRRGRLPLPHLLALIEHAAERLNDPFFALRLGYERDPRDAGVLAFMGLNVLTLAQFLGDLQRYLSVNLDGCALAVEEDGPGLSLGLDWSSPLLAGSRRTSELFIGVLLRGLRFVTRNKLSDAIVQLRHSAPIDAAIAETILQAKVEWSCERDAVAGPRAWLELPIVGGDPALLDVLRDHANHLLAEREAHSDRSIVACVEGLVLPRLARGSLDAGSIAAELDMSRRTLTRRLGSAGTSFAAIVDGLRCQLAKFYVGSQDFSLKQTAHLLGFSEQAAFNRAFRRWTGQSPSTWRRDLLRDAGPLTPSKPGA